VILRAVPDAPTGPIPFDEANAEFQERWTAARKAYADLLSQVGSLAHPLFLTGGRTTRSRFDTTQWTVEQIAKHATEIAAQVAACRDLWERADQEEAPRG
jgi:hypothetical protein